MYVLNMTYIFLWSLGCTYFIIFFLSEALPEMWTSAWWVRVSKNGNWLYSKWDIKEISGLYAAHLFIISPFGMKSVPIFGHTDSPWSASNQTRPLPPPPAAGHTVRLWKWIDCITRKRRIKRNVRPVRLNIWLSRALFGYWRLHWPCRVSSAVVGSVVNAASEGQSLLPPRTRSVTRPSTAVPQSTLKLPPIRLGLLWPPPPPPLRCNHYTTYYSIGYQYVHYLLTTWFLLGVSSRQ